MRNIVLVGFMGTGKTTVGRLLAEQTGMPLVDMDSMIEERAGKSITDIFAQDGEPHFRTLERRMVQELASKNSQVISTGGGIVINPENISDYEKTGLVVCLLASAEEILDRVRHDDTRPLLAGDKQDKILQLLESRRPLYEAVACKIDTNGLGPTAIAAKIITLYETNNP
ncbi:MAG: shikimate kinase [Verrucomicrobia bacterium]|nr:MAG: shikimate kinase [Verrucomicrobiota bacterium]